MRIKGMLSAVALLAVIGTALATSLPSCDQITARHYGGTMYVDLEHGRKLVNVTWKQDSLWVLDRKMLAGESPERYQFAEKSALGLVEGAVVIQEHRQ